MTKAQLLDRTAFESALTNLPDDLPVAVALLDVDHFKEINDSLGHDAGDSVLRSLERTLTGSIPEGASVGRLAGDEYGVIVPDSSAEAALILMEEIRTHFSSHDASPEVPRRVQLTVGIAARPAHARKAQDLIRSADEALYRAKREGRGRVAIYVEDRMTLKSNYYSKAPLERLNKLSAATGRTEASLLREALDDLLAKYREEL